MTACAQQASPSTLPPGLPKPGVPLASPSPARGVGGDAPRRGQEADAQGGFRLTSAQIVIAISFTLITGLMLGTFYVVFSAGAIHFNTN